MLKSQCFTLLSLHLTPHAFQSLSILLFQYPTVHLHCLHFFCPPLPPLLLYCFVHLKGSILCITCNCVEKYCMYKRIIRVPFPKLLHVALLHGSLPPASAAPENPSASLPLLLLAARIRDDQMKSNPVECFYLLYV